VERLRLRARRDTEVVAKAAAELVDAHRLRRVPLAAQRLHQQPEAGLAVRLALGSSIQAPSSPGRNGRPATNIATCAGPHARWKSACTIADSARSTASVAASTSTHASSGSSSLHPFTGTTAELLDKVSHDDLLGWIEEV
jgi:hypothetical protein